MGLGRLTRTSKCMERPVNLPWLQLRLSRQTFTSSPVVHWIQHGSNQWPRDTNPTNPSFAFATRRSSYLPIPVLKASHLAPATVAFGHLSVEVCWLNLFVVALVARFFLPFPFKLNDICIYIYYIERYVTSTAIYIYIYIERGR